MFETVTRSADSLWATQTATAALRAGEAAHVLGRLGGEYTLLGLLEYDDLTGDRAALTAAGSGCHRYLTQDGAGQLARHRCTTATRALLFVVAEPTVP
jgi:hypothetical protein